MVEVWPFPWTISSYSQSHALAVKTLRWRPRAGRAGQKSRTGGRAEKENETEDESFWVQLASAGTDHSVKIFNINTRALQQRQQWLYYVSGMKTDSWMEGHRPVWSTVATAAHWQSPSLCVTASQVTGRFSGQVHGTDAPRSENRRTDWNSEGNMGIEWFDGCWQGWSFRGDRITLHLDRGKQTTAVVMIPWFYHHHHLCNISLIIHQVMCWFYTQPLKKTLSIKVFGFVFLYFYVIIFPVVLQ